MDRLKTLVKTYVGDESGATSLEYALIAGLVSVALIVGASKLALNNDSAWNGLAAKVEAT